jgi:AcrR family transcriptional regulator
VTGNMVALKEERAAPKRVAAAKPVSHNLQGQRLGRKGRDTRQRILAATEELLAASEEPVTLSAVARKAGLGMTSLYVYFSDLTELLLALLEPIMASGEESYLGQLRQRWPDETLGVHCEAFIRSYYAFWRQHTRILHLRNSMSEGLLDERMARHRVSAGIPMVRLMCFQMDADAAETGSPTYSMATALFTGIDRLVAVRTSTVWSIPENMAFSPNMENLLLAEARLLELAVADTRNRVKTAG